MKIKIILFFLFSSGFHGLCQEKSEEYMLNDSTKYIRTKTSDSTCKIQKFALIQNKWTDVENIKFFKGIPIRIYEQNKSGFGKVFSFSDFGKLTSISEIKDHIHNGTHIEFYESNVIQKLGSYKNDLKIGKWSYYDKNGKILLIENYEIFEVPESEILLYEDFIDNWNGHQIFLKHGETKVFENGSLVKTLYYDRGILKG
jgi:antitoxin component YwqK of YwqJK toxin-antitoxin module